MRWTLKGNYCGMTVPSSVRCPDGPGAANPIAGWTGTTPAGGRYVISLQGAYFVSDQGCAGGPGQCEGDATATGASMTPTC
jgi:hypothetical protein